MIVTELLAQLPPPGPDETLETLLSRGEVRFERIVSTGQASPPGFWYDQAETEVVVLLAGAATLRFEADDRLIALRPGSLVEIPAHARHRVESTQAEPPTVWLAVFFP
ncbi:MAG TPA: cupin domain-containing protein [Rhodopseudomonas sp.]|uniref:cupin domain-containing protein n=1 Tax=Rhodopseudomonas sp. TaxID=1078 RepID=UPI002ED7A3F4